MLFLSMVWDHKYELVLGKSKHSDHLIDVLLVGDVWAKISFHISF